MTVIDVGAHHGMYPLFVSVKRLNCSNLRSVASMFGESED